MVFKSTYILKFAVVGIVALGASSCMDSATELNYQSTVAGYKRGKTDTQTANIRRQSLTPTVNAAVSRNRQSAPTGVIVNDPFAFSNNINNGFAPNPILAQPAFNNNNATPYGSLASGQRNVITPNVFTNGQQNIYQPAYGNNNIYSPYNPIRR